MPTADFVYQLTLTTQVVGPTIMKNVYHFVPDTVPLNRQDAAQALATEWAGAAELNALKAVISSATLFVAVDVIVLQDPLILAGVVLTGVTGAVGGEYMPQFVAWSFASERPAVGVHRGSKRFGLVAESDVANGAAIPGALTLLNALAASMNDGVTTTVGQGFAGHWTSVVVKRIKETVGGVTTYRLPHEGEVATVFPLDGWHYVRVGSQNSRKPGVGI